MSIMKMTADNVLIKADEPPARTETGIYIPESATNESPMVGTVLSVGPGTRNKKGELEPLQVKEGDRVVFARWGGTEVQIGKQQYKVVPERNIFGKIK